MLSGWKKTVLLLAVFLASGAMAQSGDGSSGYMQRYIIVLQDEPLASFEGGKPHTSALLSEQDQFEATSPQRTGKRKLDVRSAPSKAYLHYIDRAQGAFKFEAGERLGRSIAPRKVYRNALNGMAVDLTADEAAALADSPHVKSISKDRRYHLDTFAGPEWIGAGEIWSGQSGFPASRGEGIVIGVLDTGINWEHASFADPAPDGYNHINRYGAQLGLCSKPNVLCNDKLVGVYDFVEDDPFTTDVVEENTDGKDNDGHGSHTSSTAGGNVLNVILAGDVQTTLSGVAPHANIVHYRVCYIGEPAEADGGGCMGSAVLAAIDQAIDDGVDVINYSIGSNAFNPWFPGEIPLAFLNARNAGIFVVASAGNAGPNAGTVEAPANAPWVIAAGNATHNQLFSTKVENLSGGSTAPPANVLGASFIGGIGVVKIVHAKDFGFALCGAGATNPQANCQATSNSSNPWAGQQPFNGEIVVCERGTYGRVEKGLNLKLAGAGGYILANAQADGESLNADEHCLPASHVGYQQGQALSSWLATGSNHMGSISTAALTADNSFADHVASTSSRGPAKSPVQNTLKPNLIAPGTSIIAASSVGQQLLALSGTSMSSPHIAGSAALLLSVNPGWSVSQLASSLETTATAALAKDVDGSMATPLERGAGRPQLGEAANAGLYLNVTAEQFTNANPAVGGDPKNLNLTGLVDTACNGSCSFTRTLTDQMGGGNWNASAMNFPAGVSVEITPSNFTLSNGGSQLLTIEIDLSLSGIVDEWVYGDILLSATGSSDQALTTAVFSKGGELPSSWDITDNRDAGWAEFNLSGLANMPDATFHSGGLVTPTETTKTIKQDPTSIDLQSQKGHFNQIQNDDPFDGGEGVFTVWHNLPQGGLWLHAETLVSTAKDLDLYVGRDDSKDGIADENEMLCESISPDDVENCDLFNLPAGNYWVVVQNYKGTNVNGDVSTLISAAVDSSDDSDLLATGPGIASNGAAFSVRTSWRNVNALSGKQLFGAVGIGTQRSTPNNIGVIPVHFNRSGYDSTQTLPLMNALNHKFALAGNTAHEGLFVDIPPGVASLNIVAQGANGTQSNALSMELFLQNFTDALNSPPFASLPGGLASIASASGSGGNGPGIMLNSQILPGRYFVKLTNSSGNAASVNIIATVTSAASSLDPHQGLWDSERGIGQGAEWNGTGDFRFSVWYTYDDAGQPAWYIASDVKVMGNVWTADLLRVTNDGELQQENIVGKLTITFIADDRLIYSFHMLGQSGFDVMRPNGQNTCPMISGVPKSYTGHWYRGLAGLGGATVLVYQPAQAQVHYLFDVDGVPRWLIAADDDNQSATATVIPMLQFKGFCTVCTPGAVTFSTVGQVSRTFTTEVAGSWTLTFDLDSPLSQTINRTDSIEKLSDTLVCQ